MPIQIQCDECTTRTFYLMAQDDGTIEAYCNLHNHKKVIVNIPELCEAILGASEELQTNAESYKVTVTSTDESSIDVNLQRPNDVISPEAQTSATPDDPAYKHGSRRNARVSGAKRNLRS